MKLKTLAFVLALAVALSTVSASALEHLNPMPNDGQPPTLVDSGVPPIGIEPPPPPEHMEDFFYPDMLDPPIDEPAPAEKEPDYICTFGCPHDVDEPCNFPEVEVIGAGAARIVVPKGRASVPITAIDLTSLGDGSGGVTLPCIFISKYDNTTHYKTCLNHLGTGTWNGVEHINGRKDITSHSIVLLNTDTCNTFQPLCVETCSSIYCGYTYTRPRKTHVPNTGFTQSLESKSHFVSCANCSTGMINYTPCYDVAGKITCDRGGNCIVCGATYLANKHTTTLVGDGSCQACGQNFGVAINATTTTTNQTTGEILIQVTARSNGSTSLKGVSRAWIYNGGNLSITTQSKSDKELIFSCKGNIKSLNGNIATTVIIININNSALGGDYIVSWSTSAKIDTTPPNYSSHTISPMGSSWATVKKVETKMNDNFSEILNIGIFRNVTLTEPIVPYQTVKKSDLNYFLAGLDVSKEIINETLYIGAHDIAGNVMAKPITLTNIDGVPPSFTPPTEDLTDTWARSKNVVLTANDHGIGKVQIGFNEENEYKLAQQEGKGFSRTYSFFGDVYTKQVRPVYLKDGLGNAQQVLIEIDKLDNTAPTITGAKQSSVPPYNTASIMITANDEHPALGAGSGIVEYAISQGDAAPATGWQASKRFTVPGNGTYYLWAKDAVGNVTTSKFAYTVDSMDDIPPTPPIITTSPDIPWTTSDITIIIGGSTDPDGIGVKQYQYQLNDGSWVVYNAPFTVSETTEIKAKAIDLAGNESEITTASANIDRAAPSGSFSNATEWTNKSIVVTLTTTDTGGAGVKRVRPAEGVWVDGDTITQEVTVNGTYKFEVEDNAGNLALITHTIGNIDIKAPDVSKVSFIKPPDSFFRSLFSLFEPRVEMYITAADAEPDEKSGKSDIKEIEYQLVKKGQYIKPNAWKPYPLSVDDDLPEVPAKFNGTLAARCIDTAGNTSQLQGISIALEDVPPKASHSLSNADWTCDSVIVTIKGTDVDSGVRAITSPDKSIVAGDTTAFSASVNGVYDFKVEDKAGNVLNYSVTISNIDLIAPKATHTVAKGTITISAIDLDSGMATITCSHGETKGEKKECSVPAGQHVYQITDKAGNNFAYPVVVNSLKASVTGDVVTTPESPQVNPVEANPETGGGAE